MLSDQGIPREGAGSNQGRDPCQCHTCREGQLPNKGRYGSVGPGIIRYFRGQFLPRH